MRFGPLRNVPIAIPDLVGGAKLENLNIRPQPLLFFMPVVLTVADSEVGIPV